MVLPISAPVPKEYAAKFDRQSPSSYYKHQVATGPYMVENDAAGNTVGYEAGTRIHLVRNPSWDAGTDYKPAYLDEHHDREPTPRGHRHRGAPGPRRTADGEANWACRRT